MPTNDEVYDAAIQLQQAGKLEDAVGKLVELVEQDASYGLAHSALSKFYSELGKHDEAVTHGRKVCELEPEDAFSHIAMSMICQKADRIPEAEQALMEARRAQQ